MAEVKASADEVKKQGAMLTDATQALDKAHKDLKGDAHQFKRIQDNIFNDTGYGTHTLGSIDSLTRSFTNKTDSIRGDLNYIKEKAQNQHDTLHAFYTKLEANDQNSAAAFDGFKADYH